MEWQTKRQVMRMFTYGMYAVSAHHNGMRNAILANWLTQ